MKHNRVSELSEAGRAALVRELVARVELANAALVGIGTEESIRTAVIEAALSGFAFTIEEVALEELAARAEAKADAKAAPARAPPRPDAAEGVESEASQPTPKQDVHDLAAALDGRRRVWVKPGHFARALESRLEGLGMVRLREGLYAGGYAAALPEVEAVALMARLRELRVGYEQEAVPSEGA